MDYVGENKNEKVPATWWRYWTLVVAKGIEEGKHPIIRVEPTNDTDRLVLGRKVPNIHMISEDRHAELLGYERAFREGRTPDVPPAQVAEAPQLARLAAGPVRSYSKEAQLGRSPKKGRSK